MIPERTPGIPHLPRLCWCFAEPQYFMRVGLGPGSLIELVIAGPPHTYLGSESSRQLACLVLISFFTAIEYDLDPTAENPCN